MHGAYAANMAVSECDLLFSIGTRFNDRITGKLHEFAPHAQIVHIDIDTASISRNIHVDIPIVADAKEAITKMAEYVEPCSTSKWLAQIDAWKNEHPLTMRLNGVMGPLDIFNAINEQFARSSCPAALERWDTAFRARSEQKSATRTNRSSRFPVTEVCR